MLKFLLALSLCAGLYADGEYKIMIETTSCEGDSGFVSVEYNEIEKIEPADCYGVGNQKNLKQLVVNTQAGRARHTLSADEAANVLKEMKAYRERRTKTIEKSMENANHNYNHNDYEIKNR